MIQRDCSPGILFSPPSPGAFFIAKKRRFCTLCSKGRKNSLSNDQVRDLRPRQKIAHQKYTKHKNDRTYKRCGPYVRRSCASCPAHPRNGSSGLQRQAPFRSSHTYSCRDTYIPEAVHLYIPLSAQRRCLPSD